MNFCIIWIEVRGWRRYVYVRYAIPRTEGIKLCLLTSMADFKSFSVAVLKASFQAKAFTFVDSSPEHPLKLLPRVVSPE
jgi:hypothetical protein